MRRTSYSNRQVPGVAVLAVAVFQASTAGVAPRLYSAAVYESASAESGRLLAFPFDGAAFSVPVPGLHGAIVYGFDGTTVYVTTAERRVIPGAPSGSGIVPVLGIFKIDLRTSRVDPVPGSAEFSYILAFAVSRGQGRVVVSGHRRHGGRDTCGLFEISLPVGGVRPIFESPDYGVLPYGRVSLAPDGQRAVTVRRTRLEILDLTTGAERPLGDTGEKFSRAEWSPDGQWVGALVLTGEGGMNDGGSKTVLIDPNDSSRRREFMGKSDKEIVWSPDSRYLLHAVWSPKPRTSDCLTLETMDVETGRREMLTASACKVDSNNIGWISSKLLPVNGVAEKPGN